jgi:hypothetical protein
LKNGKPEVQVCGKREDVTGGDDVLLADKVHAANQMSGGLSGAIQGICYLPADRMKVPLVGSISVEEISCTSCSSRVQCVPD